MMAWLFLKAQEAPALVWKAAVPNESRWVSVVADQSFHD